MLNLARIMIFIVHLVKVSIVLTFFIILALTVFLPILYFYLRRKFRKQKAKNDSKNIVLGIFHPYCNAGGGGEKVLWVALQAIQKKYPKVDIYVYTGDVEVTPIEILENARKNMNVDLKNIKFIYLNSRRWVEGDRYPAFTLLGQALGSVYLAYEALKKLTPDVFIDTTGFSFSLPVFKYLGDCKTGSYIHYPTITRDMLRRVSNRQAIYNNRDIIARSQTLTMSKLIYYHIFAWVYSLAGQCSDITLVNSTFTLEHLTALWHKPLHLVYPPCEIDHLKKLPRSLERPKKVRIMSLAQFRPEKDHPLQLQSMYELREMVPEELFSTVTLVLCGSCRNADDKRRAKDLMDLSKHLSLENNIEFKLNLSYEDLLGELRSAYIGVHTMLDEHFGIGVVEQMAAGLIMVAHRSGGPLLDIIETSESSRLGFLAQTPQEFAYIIKFILELSDEEVNEIRERAKASVDRFNTRKFQEEFLRATEPLFK